MEKNKTALITGYTGQDGTFLTKYLLEEGYNVLGMVRRISTEPPRRKRGKFDFSKYIKDGRLELIEGDLLSVSSLINIIDIHRPDEIYNLAAQSHVGISFKQPEFTIESNFIGVVNLITAVENLGVIYKPRIYQASTSEMFGDIPQLMTDSTPKGHAINENHRLNPNSPYAIAKTAAHQYCKMKREQGVFISCGILFNHESEIRGGDFVTQKIARGAVNFANTGEPIQLGNLDAKRDWGYAGDYVKAMHAMLQMAKPDDFVIATGETRSIRNFIEAAFGYLGLKLASNQHEGAAERLVVTDGPRGGTAIEINPEFYRPNDVNYLIGDASKAKEILGWEPEHNFDVIVKIMVQAAKDER